MKIYIPSCKLAFPIANRQSPIRKPIPFPPPSAISQLPRLTMACDPQVPARAASPPSSSRCASSTPRASPRAKRRNGAPSYSTTSSQPSASSSMPWRSSRSHSTTNSTVYVPSSPVLSISLPPGAVGAVFACALAGGRRCVRVCIWANQCVRCRNISHSSSSIMIWDRKTRYRWNTRHRLRGCGRMQGCRRRLRRGTNTLYTIT